jgi:hypothetical protein
VSGPDFGLADRLRRWLDPIGCAVVEIDGWRTRGRTYATFSPYGSVNHHTAGPRTGLAPSLGICINGRPDLPGPLCHVHQQRNDVVNVVAAGVANHAGGGSWQGMRGNQSVFGLEVEHCGYGDEPFSERRLDISCRVHAAFLSGLAKADAAMQCQHFEWSNEGKIDFVRTLLPGGAPGFRFRVAQLLASGPGPGSGSTPIDEEDDMRMYLVVGDSGDGSWWLTDLLVKRYCPDLQHAKDTDWWLTQLSLGAGKPLVCNRDAAKEVAGPISIRQSYIDAVATVP